MGLVADYSGGPPRGAILRGLGYEGVVRYLPKIGGSSVKVLTSAELADLRANNIAVSVIYEARSGGEALLGYNAGVTDSKWALEQAVKLLGHIPNCIYFAVDVDVTNQMASVGKYFDGVAQNINIPRIGAYGEYDVGEYLLNSDRVNFFWQTKAWSGSRLHGAACIYQDSSQTSVNGIWVDNNKILRANWGQEPYKTSTPSGDDDMFSDNDRDVLHRIYPLLYRAQDENNVAVPGRYSLAQVNSDLDAVRTDLDELKILVQAVIDKLSVEPTA